MEASLIYFKLASTNDINIYYIIIIPGQESVILYLLFKFKDPRVNNSLSYLNTIKSDVNTLSPKLKPLHSQNLFTI